MFRCFSAECAMLVERRGGGAERSDDVGILVAYAVCAAQRTYAAGEIRMIEKLGLMAVFASVMGIAQTASAAEVVHGFECLNG